MSFQGLPAGIGGWDNGMSQVQVGGGKVGEYLLDLLKMGMGLRGERGCNS